MVSVEDLYECAQEATAAGALVLPATVTGDGFTIELDDVAAVRALLMSPAAVGQVIYQAGRRWDEQLRKVTFDGLTDQVINKVLISAGFDEDPERVCLLTLTVFLAGVRHVATATDPMFATLHSAASTERERIHARIEREIDEQDAAYAAEQDAVDQTVRWVRTDLAGTLLDDEKWLAMTTHRGREAYAKQLVAARLDGRPLEQRVVTAVLDVLAVVTDAREDVVRRRTTAFRDSAQQHGRALAASAAFHTATAKTRGAVADDYIRSVDPVIPPALVRDQLLAAARS